jgi:HK97 gp10 family phage protein
LGRTSPGRSQRTREDHQSSLEGSDLIAAPVLVLYGFREGRALLIRAADSLESPGLEQAAVSGALIVQNDAARRVAVKTGNLRRSLHTEVLSSSRSLVRVQVGTDVAYGPFIEFGTRAHVISARPGHALFWKGAKHPVRRVNHPGTRARPFLLPALRENLGAIKDEIITVLRLIFKGGR